MNEWMVSVGIIALALAVILLWSLLERQHNRERQARIWKNGASNRQFMHRLIMENWPDAKHININHPGNSGDFLDEARLIFATFTTEGKETRILSSNDGAAISETITERKTREEKGELLSWVNHED